TSFAKAYFDGYLPNKNNGNDWANLSSDYKVSWNYVKTKNGVGTSYSNNDDSGRNSILARNPLDVFSCSIGISSNNTTRTCTTDSGITININRGSSASASNCTATSPDLPGTVGCTRAGN